MDLDESRVCEVWLIVEYQCIKDHSKIGLCMSKMQKVWCKKGRRLFKRIVMLMATVRFRLFASAILTYIYAVWSAEQAFLQRGYKAYGGEYLAIPFVFWGAYKGLEWITWTLHRGAT